MRGSGYPDPEDLDRVEAWPGKDVHPATVAQYDWVGLMAFVKTLWSYDDWGWSETDIKHPLLEGAVDRIYSLSTGGWSGNEDVIEALNSNHLFWGLCWESSSRGGHHEFRVRLP